MCPLNCEINVTKYWDNKEVEHIGPYITLSLFLLLRPLIVHKCVVHVAHLLCMYMSNWCRQSGSP